MRAQYWMNLQHILAMSLYDETLTQAKNTKLFREKSLLMKAEFHPQLNLTEAMCEDWMAQHYNGLRSAMSTMHYRRVIEGRLKDMRVLENRTAILFKILELCKSETDAAKNAKNLNMLSMASSLWGETLAIAV